MWSLRRETFRGLRHLLNADDRATLKPPSAATAIRYSTWSAEHTEQCTVYLVAFERREGTLLPFGGTRDIQYLLMGSLCRRIFEL